MLFRRKLSERKIRHLYTIVSKTGFALCDDLPDLSEAQGMALITPEASSLAEFSHDDWLEYMRSNLPLLIHNVVSARDFPVDGQLQSILLEAEQKLSESSCPWCDFLFTSGSAGIAPTRESLAQLGFDQQAALGLGRANFERMMGDIAQSILRWCEPNRANLDAWHVTHASKF